MSQSPTSHVVFPICYGDIICQYVCQHKRYNFLLHTSRCTIAINTAHVLSDFKYNIFTQTCLMIDVLISSSSIMYYYEVNYE